ncbi:MAG: hypothetical protein IH614_00715 [Desulfuromonadales bacterium]|nr:hypothetical protein [Desulfuromonadales bacterium]
MPVASELEKIRDTIRQIEDPAAAMALRHVCKALEELQEETRVSPAGRAKGEKEIQPQ